MPVKYILDKTLPCGGSYRAEIDKAYVIRKAGTADTAKVTLRVAGAPCLEIVDKVAPQSVKAASRKPLLDLEDLYVVVPPGKTLEILGTTNKFIRVKGEILDLAPGEVLTTTLLARYAEQFKKFLSYRYASWTSSAAAAIPKGDINDIISFTCPAGEKHVFDSFYGGYTDCTAYPAGVFLEELGTRIYVDDKPWDIMEDTMGFRGISSIAAPIPPDDTFGAEPFSLKDMPIVLTPGRKLRIAAYNADAAFTLASGQTLTSRVGLLDKVEYI